MQSFCRWKMLAAAACLFSPPAHTQDMMRHVDLASPMFSSAEVTRAEVEASLQASPGGADFSGKSLNGLDLSGLDFSNVSFRAARMNKTNF
ncbi:MAG: pentapeptide repeat-containing protein [Methylocella sp.]